VKAYDTILCPTDLSAAGDAAVDFAYDLASENGTVVLLHVCEPSYVVSPLDATYVVSYPTTAEGQEAVENKARQHLRRLVAATALARGIRTEHVVVHDSNPAVVIEREAQRVAADLIVMGTHGRTGLGRMLMGSVATDVLRKSRVPVLLYHAARRTEASALRRTAT
jgi:nucleotide-binding universal stress UspA family protein